MSISEDERVNAHGGAHGDEHGDERMAQELVSVILPVYNRGRVLEDSIRSVLSQSYADLELLVVDDASTEDLSPVIERFDDPRLRFVRRPRNGGASAARNTGLGERARHVHRLPGQR